MRLRIRWLALITILLTAWVYGNGLAATPADRLRVDARDGWWSDVLIVSDGSGPTDVLRTLRPDALNWAHYELPSYLADIGTRRVASAGLEYQESEELPPDDLEGWAFASSLAYDVFDLPMYYAQWGGSYFMDPHASAWASAVLEGIRDALADNAGVSQDNIGVPPFIKGRGGFSPREKAQFVDFLLERFSPIELLLLGIDVTSFDIAAHIRTHGYLDGNPGALEDPVFRAFVLYQYVSNLDIWRGMLEDLGIDASTDKIVHGNQYGVWGRWDSNPYSVLLSQLHQVIEIEYVGYLDTVPPDARDSLIYKIGLASGLMEKPVWIRGIVYDWGRQTAVLRAGHLLALTASAYANGAVRTFEYSHGTPQGTVDIPEDASESLLAYYGWLDEVRFLFEKRRPVADVAVVYSIPTLMWRYFPATGHFNAAQIAGLSGFADVLDREHILYDVVIFGHPDLWSDEGLAERLASYDVAILPDVDCLSGEQVEILQAFVASGGRLLVTGDTGARDEGFVVQNASRTASLLGHPNVVRLDGTPGRSLYRSSDAGRSAERQPIASRVRALLGDDLVLRTSAPDTVCINAYTTGSGLYTVHLLNLGYDENTDVLEPTGPFEVRFRLPPNARATDSRVFLFGDDGTRLALDAVRDGAWTAVTVPGVATHAILAVGDLGPVAAPAIAACESLLRANPWAARQSDVEARLDRAADAHDTGDWLGVLELCAELESLIAASAPIVLYDFSHEQETALTEADARMIDPEHPDWHLIAELASHVTRQHAVGPITDEVLRGVNVLAVAMHRDPFDSDEVAAVDRFVRNGGGLLLIGNGGPPRSTAALTEPFGVRFLRDSCLMAEEHLWDAISFDVFDIAEHPTAAGVERIQLNYAAPMTVDGGWTVVASTAEAVWQEPGEDERPSPGELRGPFPVVAVRAVGDGRIAAVCDDAPFREWGNPSLVYNLIMWLAGDG